MDTLGKMVGRQDYNSYTELEMHAELVYAECLLLKAMLTVCEDETLVSFVKAGLKVRQCYISFRYYLIFQSLVKNLSFKLFLKFLSKNSFFIEY